MSQEEKPADPIYVTRTFLPPRAEYDAWLDKVCEPCAHQQRAGT